MHSKLRKMIELYIKNSRNRSIWQKIVQVMACIVVFCTTYALILPAITMEQTYYCGMEVHEHTADCYEQIVVEEQCFCTEEQLEMGIHTPQCTEVSVTQGALICTLPEHTHVETCHSDTSADVESAADWEQTLSSVVLTGEWSKDLLTVAQTQIGYAESARNYQIEAGDVQKGYTRYGAWYGIPYGDWDAMFVSFCLAYAQIPQEVVIRESDSLRLYENLNENEWIQQVGTYTAQPGDLVFLYEENGSIGSVGIVAEAQTELDTSTQTEQLTHIKIIQGDYEKEVSERYINIQDGIVAGFVNLEQLQQLYNGDDLLALQPLTVSEDILSEDAQNENIQKEDVQNDDVQNDDTQQEELTSQENTIEEGPVLMSAAPNDVALAAEAATVTLDLYSYNEWCPISLRDGDNYSATVGSTITLTIADSNGANYSEPKLEITGGEVVSQTYSCAYSGCSHSIWCVNPVHTIVIKVISPNVSIIGQVDGSSWNSSYVTIDESSGGGEIVEPTPTPTPEPPEDSGSTSVPQYPHYPDSVITGSVDISRLRFYNFAEDGGTGVVPLAGCVFEITGANGYSVTVVSGGESEVELPQNIPNGTYTITEVSAPFGYMRDTKYQRTFKVENGKLVSGNNIGIFINHSLNQLETSKTAEVEDYNNRIYQILLSAKSHMRLYEMDPIDVLFVVDQSNSMLFPSGLKETGKQVELSLNGNNNINNMEALKLDKNQLYYIISDETGTSTVWAIWYNGQAWIYQDASYYAKAKQNNAPGYHTPGEEAIPPPNNSYQTNATNEKNTGKRSNGGGLGYPLNGSGLGNDIDKMSNDKKTFKLYTATGEYNRLHYLEEALTAMIYELADYNTENRVTLIEFTKLVNAEDCKGPLKLTPGNVEELVGEIRNINTSGGTRQDIALKYAYEKYLNTNQGYSGNPSDTFTILITDGAPVASSGSTLGTSTDGASTNSSATIYSQIKGWANEVKKKSTLMTVGLGMDNVTAGKDVLNQIASDKDHFCALDDASELVREMQELLYKNIKAKETLEISGDVMDEISNSFYPIAWTNPGVGISTGRKVLVHDTAKDWILLNEGDWITLEGKYTTAGEANAAGQLCKKEDGTYYIVWSERMFSDVYLDDSERIAWVEAGTGNNTGRTVVYSDGTKDWILLNAGDWITQEGKYYAGTPNYWEQRYYGQVAENNGVYSINWGRSASGANRQTYPGGKAWKGTFYVKAKEDFIGGNGIETNKVAKVTVGGADKYLDRPTVNVRLLDMNAMNSEVTVYLGDIINETGNSPLDSLKYFYQNTEITKLIPDNGNVMNKVNVGEAEGLKEDTFTLRYAIGRDLTEGEWDRLMNGEAITVQYIYDIPSSKGPVGFFTFQLEKSGIDRANPQYKEHGATAACQPNGQPLTQNCTSPAEIYKLHIQYESYELNEMGRPETNVHNGTGSPGTEVGTGSELETGKGSVEVDDVHEVHVISGSIEITKKFKTGLSDSEDRTFTFILHRQEDGEDTSKDVMKTITIPANTAQGSASIIFDNLRRGTYVVTEAVDEDYTVEEITVLNKTNCYSSPAIGETAKEVTFVMGNNISNNNVIGRYGQTDVYTSYTDPVNGVYGAAEFTNKENIFEGQIPVQKIWDDGAQAHSQDVVYVVLMKDNNPVLDAEGRAMLLQIDASTNWQGSFTVVLTNKDDQVSNYNYSVKEVSQVSKEALYNWQGAILQNDHTTMLYYEKALEAGGVIGVGDNGYMPQYKNENGTWIVKNNKAVVLPQTGGMGTTSYTISGLLLMIAGVIYGYRQRRMRERRGRK